MCKEHHAEPSDRWLVLHKYRTNFKPPPVGHRNLYGRFAGTPAYMAPELLSGSEERLTSPRAVDVFRYAVMRCESAVFPPVKCC